MRAQGEEALWESSASAESSPTNRAASRLFFQAYMGGYHSFLSPFSSLFRICLSFLLSLLFFNKRTRLARFIPRHHFRTLCLKVLLAIGPFLPPLEQMDNSPRLKGCREIFSESRSSAEQPGAADYIVQLEMISAGGILIKSIRVDK